MSDGFIKAADIQQPTSASTGSSVISMADPSTADDYTFGAIQGSMTGTVLPRTGRKHELRNSESPFGKIVEGRMFRYVNGELDEGSITSFRPTHLRDFYPNSDKEPAKAPVEEVDEDLTEEAADLPEESEAEKQLREIMEEAAKHTYPIEEDEEEYVAEDDKMQEASISQSVSLKAMALMVSEAVRTGLREAELEKGSAELEQDEHKPVRVQMSGSFGSYRGIYEHIYVQGDLVILVYKSDEQVFSPPPREDELELSCDGNTYEVYFPGIEFELPFTGCGIQVMIRRAA